jgi:hypothetical protein
MKEGFCTDTGGDFLIDIGEIKDQKSNLASEILRCLAKAKGSIMVPESKGFVKPYSLQDFWEGCFPTLFPYGTGGPNCQKRIKHYTSWDKHVLREYTQRFARHKGFLIARYYYTMQKQMGRVAWVADKF